MLQAAVRTQTHQQQQPPHGNACKDHTDPPLTHSSPLVLLLHQPHAVSIVKQTEAGPTCMSCGLAPVLSCCVSSNTNIPTAGHTQHATPQHLEVLLTAPGAQTDVACAHNPDAVACYQKWLHAWCDLYESGGSRSAQHGSCHASLDCSLQRRDVSHHMKRCYYEHGGQQAFSGLAMTWQTCKINSMSPFCAFLIVDMRAHCPVPPKTCMPPTPVHMHACKHTSKERPTKLCMPLLDATQGEACNRLLFSSGKH